MADSTSTSTRTQQQFALPPPLSLGNDAPTESDVVTTPDDAVAVMVSYIVSLIKSGNGIYLQDGNNHNDNIHQQQHSTTPLSSSPSDCNYCMYSTYMNQLEGAPPTNFMPMGENKPILPTVPLRRANNTNKRQSESPSSSLASVHHVDPFSDTIAGPTTTSTPTSNNKAPSESSFVYDRNTSVFPKKAHVDRAVVWGLLENGSSASPLGEYAAPSIQRPQHQQQNQPQVDFSPDPAHVQGGLFPNGPGLLWTLELITTERAVSMLNDSEWSTISKDDVMLGNALQSEIDFVNHKATLINVTTEENTTEYNDNKTTAETSSSGKQQQQLLHNSSSSATFASPTTPGGQTNVTEDATIGQRSSDVSPFYEDSQHGNAVLVGASFDGGNMAQNSKQPTTGMGLRHGSSLSDVVPVLQQQKLLAHPTPHHHDVSSAGSLEVEALTINQQRSTSPNHYVGDGSAFERAGSSQPKDDIQPASRPTTQPSGPKWSREAILEPTPYDIKCIDIFEDLVRSLYAERIHNPNPDIQRVCASAVVGSAVLLFLRYVHLMGGDCAAEYHKFCCDNIITPDQLSEAGGESRVLLPNSNVTWQPGCWVPPSIVMLRQRRFDMSASLRAALQVVRVFHDGYRIQTSGSQVHLGQYRLHLLRTLNYDVTVIPPHAYIDGLCCSHAGNYILYDLGKTGGIDHGVAVSSPGNFLRSVRTNIDTAIQHTSLVTSCRHVSWIAAAAISEALLWFTTVVAYFEDVSENSGLDGDAVMEAAMVQYNLNKVALFQSIHAECGPAAAFYIKKAVDTMYILRTRTN